jgi:hypothetical protein
MADEGLAASLGATATDGLPWAAPLKRVYINGQPPAEMPTAPVDPNAGLAEALSRSTVLPPQPPAGQVEMNQPFGEVKASPPAPPSERITQGVQQLLSAAGADNYTANNLANKLMGLVGATPAGAPLSLMDAAHYQGQGETGSTAMAMAGAIPGVKPVAKVARAAVQEIAAPAIKRSGNVAEDLANNLRYNYSGPMTGEASAGKTAPPNPYIQTVDQPYRMMYPGIYRDPREIAATANARVAPENPAMKQLWGVSRGDLDEIGRARGPGMEIPDISGLALKPKGATSAVNIMNPRNEQRLIDTLVEGGKYPGLRHADAWYVMDPMYHRLEQMFGPEEAVSRYRDLNNMMGMASPGSDVLTEIQRGSAAHWLNKQGRWDDFKSLAGVAEKNRGDNYPGRHALHPGAPVSLDGAKRADGEVPRSRLDPERCTQGAVLCARLRRAGDWFPDPLRRR